MNEGIQILKAYVELDASHEDMQDSGYAENRINAMSNFQLLEMMGEAADWVDEMSDAERQKRGWS